MNTGNVTPFCKQAACPSAETLLSYYETSLAAAHEGRVAAHLATCDFCCAELQLLARCPPAGEYQITAVAMPQALRRLAEELFAGSPLTVQLFHEAVFEKERLTLTDA